MIFSTVHTKILTLWWNIKTNWRAGQVLQLLLLEWFEQFAVHILGPTNLSNYSTTDHWLVLFSSNMVRFVRKESTISYCRCLVYTDQRKVIPDIHCILVLYIHVNTPEWIQHVALFRNWLAMSLGSFRNKRHYIFRGREKANRADTNSTLYRLTPIFWSHGVARRRQR